MDQETTPAAKAAETSDAPTRTDDSTTTTTRRNSGWGKVQVKPSEDAVKPAASPKPTAPERSSRATAEPSGPTTAEPSSRAVTEAPERPKPQRQPRQPRQQPRTTQGADDAPTDAPLGGR